MALRKTVAGQQVPLRPLFLYKPAPYDIIEQADKLEFDKAGKADKAMKKPKRKRTVIVIAAILLFIAANLFYSRPMTIQQRYPTLTSDKCIELRGYYRSDGQMELTEFTIDKNSEEFEILCDLLYERDYCRSFRDLFPRDTRIHPMEPGDYQWEVCFRFEDILFPDGSIGSGGMLSIQYWYGELDIHFDGDVLSCHTNEQETWAKEVLNIIQ